MTNSNTYSSPSSPTNFNPFSGMGMRKGGRPSLFPGSGDGSTLNLDFTTGVLDPRLTFNRASTATFVNSSGYVEWAGANTAPYSESLTLGSGYSDNAILSRSTTTSPTGNTAVVFYPTVVLDYHRLQFGSPVAVVGATTISVYVKQIGSDYRAGINATTYIGASVICSLVGNGSVVGAVGGTAPNRAATITKVTDDGWYRITLTGTYNTISSVYVFMASSTSTDSTGLNFLGVASQGIAIWGLQINPGSTAQTYYPTTTAAYHAPRFDNALLTSRTNLVLQSNDFSTSPWVQKYGTVATLTSNYTVAGVPDGFSGTATRLQSSVAASGITQPLSFTPVSGKTIRFSLYIKSNTTADQFVLMEDVTSGGIVWIATPVWQRFQFGSLISITKFGIEGLGAGLDISICGAQVEYVNTGTSATAYIPTTTTQVSANTTEPRGLLIEGQTQNVLFYSQDVMQTSRWTIQGGIPSSYTSVSVTGGTAPDNTNTANLCTESTANNSRSIYQSLTATAGTYTASVWVKAGTGSTRYIRLVIPSAAGNFVYVTVNISTGAVTQDAAAVGTASAASATVTSYPGSWYRIALKGTLAAAVNFVFIVPLDSATPAVSTTDYGREAYLGNGSTFLIWGAQLELGSGASSYIPTGASGVTRNTDYCTIPTASFISGNPYPQTLFVDCIPNTPSGAFLDIVRVFDRTVGGTFSYGTEIYYYTASTMTVSRKIAASTNTERSFASGLAYGTRHKFALSIDASSYSGSYDGVTALGVATAPTALATVATHLGIGCSGDSSPNAVMFGTIRQIKFYPTALAQAQINALTAL